VVLVGVDVKARVGVFVAVEVEVAVKTTVDVEVKVEVCWGVGVLTSGLTGDCKLRVAQARGPIARPNPKRMIQNRDMLTPENVLDEKEKHFPYHENVQFQGFSIRF
jgi:hypothetical protein